MPKIRLRKLRKWAVLACLGGLVAGIGYNLIFPGISYLKNRPPLTTAFMEYRRAMAEKVGKGLTISRRWVPLASISLYLVQAVVICEDDKFWIHHGFDFQAIKVAVEKDIKEKSYRFGGSTITQQLAKNLFLSPSNNPMRKLREFILAWRLERTLSKKRILELYLNEVEWGNGIFGAEAAAEHYYGKPAAELSPEEAAHLAVILPSPRRYNPLGGTKYVEDRVREVLEIMSKRGIIPPAGAEQ
jgi:monofunctional biosynthetic peptidoglycan transglycosylase